MKGTCEIQLINADGSIAQKTRDDNLVTNAIQNLLNPPPIFFAEGGDYATYMRSVIGSMENLLGGVMLWSEQMEENPDNILPKDITTQVGYAGNDAYTGTNAFRGSFNTIESGPTHNGYKFVWDFPTSASNGTIKCVTLTSGLGGRCGWWGDDTTAISRGVGHYARNSNDGIDKGRKWIGWPIASVSPGKYIFLNSTGSLKSLDICEVEIPTYELNASSKSVFTYSVGRDFQEVTQTRITTPVNCWRDYRYQAAYVNTYDDYIGMVYPTSSSRDFTYTKISMSQKALISQTNIKTTFEVDVGDMCCLEYEGYLYMLNYSAYTKLVKINLSDLTDITTVDLPKAAASNVVIRRINGLLAIIPTTYGDTAFGWYLIGNEFYPFKPNLNAVSYQIANISYAPAIKEPFFLSPGYNSSYGTYYSYGIVNIYNAYLATINNLSTPVVKTASQTMKVTYTVTDVEAPKGGE